MTQAMMPPPLPGYPPAGAPGMPPQVPGYGAPPAAAAPMPAPAAPPPPLVQGYPGPAVAAAPGPAFAPQPGPAFAPPPQAQQAAPQPGYAPAPQGYAPPQAAPPHGYGALPPQQAYAPPQGYAPAPQGYGAPQQGYAPQAAPIGDIGAAIAEATGGDRNPQPDPGFQYVWEILETLVTMHPQKRTLTFKANLKVLESSNPNQPPGCEVSYIEGLQYGAGRVQQFLMAGSGFPSKALYDQTMAGAGRDPKVELQLLGNAAGNSTTPQPGNHYGPNPLKGRRIRSGVTMGTRTIKNGPNAGQLTQFRQYQFAPG